MNLSDTATVAKLRVETGGVRNNLIHLNNAGCSLPPDRVVEAQLNYLRREAEFGGYETAELHVATENDFYSRMADLIGARPDEVGFCESATVAWRRLINNINLPAGSVVAYDETIYGGNLLALLQAAERFGWTLLSIPVLETGLIDVEVLEDKFRRRLDLVAITHVPAHSGAVNPIAEIGRLAHDNNAVLVVDACQSLGQLPIDVNAMFVDALAFTGRKYLRGPRGTGGYYMGKRFSDRIRPVTADIRSAKVVSPSGRRSYDNNARILENWERNWGAFIGLTEALKYLSDLSQTWIWTRVSELANELARILDDVDGVALTRHPSESAGIVVFDVPSMDLLEVRDKLRSRRINTMFAGTQNAPVYMLRRRSRGWIRASVHYYNEIGEFHELADELKAIQSRS